MEQFIKFIDEQLPSKRGDELLFKFKRKTLGEMNQRYSEVMQRGITDSKVLTDLIISEHADIKKAYEKFYASEREKINAKRKTILNIVGSVVFILSLIVVYLGISFTTQAWGKTWLIPVDGILIWVAYILTLVVNKVLSLKRIFHIFARLALAGEIMVITVALFLFVLVMFGFSASWLVVIGGIATMFVIDGAFAVVTEQKLAIMNILIYLPVIATMLFIIIGAAGIIPWSTGWLIIIASLVLDFIIVAVKMGVNKQQKQEVIDAWKED